MKRCPHCNLRFDDTLAVCPNDRTALVELPDPLVGRTLAGRYRIERRIGVGGMGAVYLAQHLLLRRLVALKLLAPELTRDPVMRERFIREAQATNLLKHPNIVDIWDVAEEGSRVFLVMEYLQGVSLADRLREGALPVRETLEVMVPVAEALERAHQLHVVHRDVKPENVFLCRDELGAVRVKVLDFGIVHIKSEARLTGPGEIFGTPEYMAPEQSRAEPCGPATDLYAVGVMLFELLTGTLPFNGTVSQLILHHAHTPAPRLASRVPAVPASLDLLVDELLRKAPAQRPPDATALLARLRAVLHEVAPELAAIEAEAHVRAPSPSSEPHPVSPSESPHPDAGGRSAPTEGPGAVTVASLRQHHARFVSALAAVHPRGDVPAWVSVALASLATHLDALEEREDQRRALAFEGTERERRGQRERDRLVDAWKQRAFERNEETTRLRSREQRFAELGREFETALQSLQAAWFAAGSAPLDAAAMSLDRALAIEQAGARAARWRRVALDHATARDELAALRAEVDAIARQESELKDRVAESKEDLVRQRAESGQRLTELSAELNAVRARALELGDRLARYLNDHPAARGLIAWSMNERDRAAG